MTNILNSLAIVMLLIGTGFALKRVRFLSEAQWEGIERIAYHVFFPALIVTALATARLGSVDVPGIMIGVLVPSVAMTGLLFLLRRRLARAGLDGPGFTSVVQGVIRWNTFVALALAFALHGSLGLTAMAVAAVALLPYANVVSLLTLARHGENVTRPNAMQIVRSLAVNPFIWSTALGLALNPIAGALPAALLGFGEQLGRAALATGLIMVGSGLRADDLHRPTPALLIAAALRLLGMPLLALLTCRALGVPPMETTIVLIATAVPTAAAAYILAKAKGGDATLMAAIITAQTLAAALTLPLLLLLVVKP